MYTAVNELINQINH